jgi:hypothetical protein
MAFVLLQPLAGRLFAFLLALPLVAIVGILSLLLVPLRPLSISFHIVLLPTGPRLLTVARSSSR